MKHLKNLLKALAIGAIYLLWVTALIGNGAEPTATPTEAIGNALGVALLALIALTLKGSKN